MLAIGTYRHRGLKRLYQQGHPSRIRADQVGRVADVLAHMDIANHPSDLDLPEGGAFDVDLVDFD